VVLPDGRRIDYLVDGWNRRVAKKVNGAFTQKFLYGDQLRIAAELNASNAVVSRFVYATRVNVPDYVAKGSSTYRIITDHLGSPRLVINVSTGAIAQRMDYDEFGRVILDTSPGFQPFGFAGGLYDPDTGLVRFGARDYDAEAGRWMGKDPILFEGTGANLYLYALVDPVNLIDLEGEFVAPASGVVGGVVVEVGGTVVLAAGSALVIGVAIGTGINYFVEDYIQEGLDKLFLYEEPEAGRKPWQPNKPGRKKQGREPGEKKRQHPSWKPQNPPKEPPKHTPSKKNQKC